MIFHEEKKRYILKGPLDNAKAIEAILTFQDSIVVGNCQGNSASGNYGGVKLIKM